MPKLKNCNFNRVVLVKYDIILNFIKIGGYLEDGPRMGPKGPESGPKCQELVPKAQYNTQNYKTFYYNRVVLLKYDIILNCIKISGYIGYGHIWGPKGLF